MVSTSTWVRSDLMCSLCSTPNRCSSSTTTRPRSFQRTPGLQQAMRADHDVHRPVGHAVDHGAGLGGVGEPGQALDRHREPGHPVAEGLQMLVGQQGGGHQHGDLFAVLNRFERRAHRDLGLAVADVAADHPVHRHRLLHVGLDLGDRGELVNGLGEAERVLHLGLPGGVRSERVSGAGLPLGVQRDQLAGDLAHRAAGLGLGVGPVAAAQLAQRRGLAADVPRQLIQGIHWDIELVSRLALLAGRVLQHQVFAPCATNGALDHLDEPPDAVLIVHHQVTGRQRQRVDGVAALGREPLAVDGRGPAAGQIGFGDDDQVGAGYHNAAVQRTLEHPDDTTLGSGARRPASRPGCRIRPAAPPPDARCRFPARPSPRTRRSRHGRAASQRWSRCRADDPAPTARPGCRARSPTSSLSWLNVHHGWPDRAAAARTSSSSAKPDPPSCRRRRARRYPARPPTRTPRGIRGRS